MADSSSNATSSTNDSAVFHDFFFLGPTHQPPRLTSDVPSAEKQVSNHLEGVPFYGHGSDLSVTEMSNRSIGNKRSLSDSGFMGSSSSRVGFQHTRPDSSDGFHLMKIPRNAGAERPKRAHDEGMYFSMNPLRPTSTPLLSGSPSGSRTNASGSRLDQAIPLNVGSIMPHAPLRMGMVQAVNRFKDGNRGPSGISQSAADEGSRTGIKGSGLLSSTSGGIGISDRTPSEVLLRGHLKNIATPFPEPESSASPSHHGSASANRQMTIFYGGQAHVFDDVHPNKADVIMALAGSNGGSWSTSYAKSVAPVSRESNYGNTAGVASKYMTPGEIRRGLSIVGSTTTHGFCSGDQISLPPGARAQGSTSSMKCGEDAVEMGMVQKQEM